MECGMEKQTLEKLAAAFEVVEHDLSGRAAELVAKCLGNTLAGRAGRE
jgi:hypothetical protein